MTTFHLLMASSSGIGGLFTSLGLNVQAFVLDTLAFLVTVYVLKRWVYPPLTRALDAKKDELEAAVRLEHEATTKLSEAQEQGTQMVAEARRAADEILATSREQASAQLEEARIKAQSIADRTVVEAREQIARDVRVARQELRNDTAKLVASAVETILDEKLDGTHDAALIGRSLGGQS